MRTNILKNLLFLDFVSLSLLNNLSFSNIESLCLGEWPLTDDIVRIDAREPLPADPFCLQKIRFFFFSSKGVFPKIWGHPTHSIGSTYTTLLFSFR